MELLHFFVSLRSHCSTWNKIKYLLRPGATDQGSWLTNVPRGTLALICVAVTVIFPARNSLSTIRKQAIIYKAAQAVASKRALAPTFGQCHNCLCTHQIVPRGTMAKLSLPIPKYLAAQAAYKLSCYVPRNVPRGTLLIRLSTVELMNMILSILDLV